MEQEHIVGAFDADLDRIKDEILEMGKLVKKQIRAATNALLEMELEEVDSLIATDRKINGMNKNINTLAEQMIAMRQPMAVDLRLALMATNIATELERLGDHAKSTAKRVRRLSDTSPKKSIMSLIEKMSDHHLNSGGKRLRALLTLESAKLTGYKADNRDNRSKFEFEFKL